MPTRIRTFVFAIVALSLSSRFLIAQPTFKELPGYEKYQEISSLRAELSGGGRVEQIRWTEDGQSIQYSSGGKRKSIDLTSFAISDSDAAVTQDINEGRRGQRRTGQTPVGRAQQRTVATSPDGKWKATYVDFNITLETTDADAFKVQVTKEGEDRLRFGTGCWVYGEELNQSDAMWWSPDSAKLAYYEVDERGGKRIAPQSNQSPTRRVECTCCGHWYT